MGKGPSNADASTQHEDAFAEVLPTRVDKHREVDLVYKGSSDDDSDSPVKAQDISISHPVEDVSELKFTAHLAALLGHQHSTPDDDSESRTSNDPQQEFDFGVLRTIPETLAFLDVEIDLFPVPAPRVRALILGQARDISVLSLTEHLQENSTVADAMGFDPDAVTYNKLNRAKNELEQKGHQDVIKHVSMEAVYAIARSPILVPPSVANSYEFGEMTGEIDMETIDPETRRRAIRNWIQFWLDEVAAELSFGRTGNCSYSFEQLLAMYIHSALQGGGVEGGTRSAEWLYDDLPNGNTPIWYIGQMDIGDIESMCTAAQTATLEICQEYRFFDNPVTLGVDKTTIKWTGRDNRWTIGTGKPNTKANWELVSVSILQREKRFSLGVRLLQSRDEIPAKVDSILDNAAPYLEIDRIYADSEFKNGDCCDKFRRFADATWFVDAKTEDDTEELLERLPKGQAGIREGIDDFTTPQPNAVAIPTDDESSPPSETQTDTQRDSSPNRTLDEFRNTNTDSGSSQSADDSSASRTEPPEFINFSDLTVSDNTPGVGNTSTHEALLTDVTPDDDIPLKEVFADFDDRASIERFYGQLKHDFLPVCESKSPVHRLWTAKLAVLLFNFHALINRAASPELGLPLTVDARELLTAMRDVLLTTE